MCGLRAKLVSHGNQEMDAIFIDNLSQFLETEDYANAEVISINELQFFDAGDVRYFIERARYVDHKHLILCGLASDSENDHFMDFNYLIPQCTQVTKLSAKCYVKSCFNDAHRTYANFNKQSRTAVNTAKDAYVPLCDAHWFQAQTIGTIP